MRTLHLLSIRSLGFRTVRPETSLETFLSSRKIVCKVLRFFSPDSSHNEWTINIQVQTIRPGGKSFFRISSIRQSRNGSVIPYSKLRPGAKGRLTTQDRGAQHQASREPLCWLRDLRRAAAIFSSDKIASFWIQTHESSYGGSDLNDEQPAYHLSWLTVTTEPSPR